MRATSWAGGKNEVGLATLNENKVIKDKKLVWAGAGDRYSIVVFGEIEGLDVIEQGSGVSKKESSTVSYIDSLHFHICHT